MFHVKPEAGGWRPVPGELRSGAHIVSMFHVKRGPARQYIRTKVACSGHLFAEESAPDRPSPERSPEKRWGG
jgi:hypothetical protein